MSVGAGVLLISESIRPTTVLLQIDNTLYTIGLIGRAYESEGEGVKECECRDVADPKQYPISLSAKRYHSVLSTTSFPLKVT
jgi:hypothetical protein